MSSRYDVVGVGIASWDLIGVASRAPLMGAKQQLAQWIEGSGGPVATALITLTRLGMRTCLVSAVGSDHYGARIVADLDREGVDTHYVHIHDGRSHVAFALVEPGGGQRTIWWHNDRSVLERVSLERALLTSARALLIDTHLPDVALCAAQWMHEAGGLVMIDAERYKEQTLALLPCCDAIVVSERFGRETTGAEQPDQAAQWLYERYHPLLVVVTAGEQGSWCVSQHERFHTPAFAVDALDTTGAGDVFHGALLYALVQQWPLREAVRFASATAALKCRVAGGRAGIPTLEEVTKMLSSASASQCFGADQPQ